MNDALQQRIEACETLPTLPAVALEVVRLCQQDRVQGEEIGEVTSQDPALAARILRLANSPYFGLRHEVTTVSHAVVMLGIVSVRTIALGFSLVNSLSDTRSSGFNLRDFWARSLVAGAAAREISRTTGTGNREEAFLGALLQNLGLLVLSAAVPRELERVLRTATRHDVLPQVEQKVLGSDHAEVGAWLATKWGLPQIFRDAIRYHHDPLACPEPRSADIVKVVAASDLLAEAWVGEHAERAIARARTLLHEFWGVTDQDFGELFDRLGLALPEVAEIFEIEIADGADLKRVQDQAREILDSVPLTDLLEKAMAMPPRPKPGDQRAA
jgi:HD-like signal output (HDOD) protein